MLAKKDDLPVNLNNLGKVNKLGTKVPAAI
jgi:hypothetical protein